MFYTSIFERFFCIFSFLRTRLSLAYWFIEVITFSKSRLTSFCILAVQSGVAKATDWQVNNGIFPTF